MIDPCHQDESSWQEMVEPYRKRMESASRANLDKMRQFLRGRECAADLLAPVYEVAWESRPDGPARIIPVARACAGLVPHCRRSGAERSTEAPQIPRIPWQWNTGVSAPASRLLDDTNRVVVFYDSTLDRQTLRRWRHGMAVLAFCGVRNLITLPRAPLQAEEVQGEFAEHSHIFVVRNCRPSITFRRHLLRLSYLPVIRCRSTSFDRGTHPRHITYSRIVNRRIPSSQGRCCGTVSRARNWPASICSFTG